MASTRDRVAEVAARTFAERGVAGTSLDELARRSGVTKQTILYHFGSKDELLASVLAESAAEVRSELEAALATADRGWGRVEASVRAVFALAVRRPELLGLLREVGRLGPGQSDQVADILRPLIDRSLRALTEAMDEGRLRRSDPRLVLAVSHSLLTSVVTDTEALRALGLELDLRVAARLRRMVLDMLAALLADL